MTSSIFDVTLFPTFFYKHASAKTIYLKVVRIVDFDVKLSMKIFRPVGKFSRRYDITIEKGLILLGDSSIGGLLPTFYFRHLTVDFASSRLKNVLKRIFHRFLLYAEKLE